MPRPPVKPSKTKGKAKENSLHTFLNIPLELREIIYKHILLIEPDTLTDLLVVNRKLFREVLPFQFKRHLTFNGQDELFCWLDHVHHQYLHHVVDITFALHDINPEMIVGALGKRLRQANLSSSKGQQSTDPQGNPYHAACDMEIRKLAEAFKLIPNLRKLTIDPTAAGDPRPPQRMLSTFSRMLAHRFPYLHTIICYEDEMPVDYLANKPRLRRLRFPAISPNNNADVARIFSTLSLTDLEIFRLPHHANPQPPKRRIIAEVFRSLRPLTSLSLYEEREAEGPDLAYEVFAYAHDALQSHRQSLKCLRFFIDTDNDDDEMEEARDGFRQFLREEAVGLQDLEVFDSEWYARNLEKVVPRGRGIRVALRKEMPDAPV